MFFLLSFIYDYVVSVRRDFIFLLVLGIGYVILLWHSLCLPCIFEWAAAFACDTFVNLFYCNSVSIQ